DIVIRKNGVAAGQFNLLHVTTDAAALCHRARFRYGRGGRRNFSDSSRGAVTRLAFSVVSSVIAHQILVRIMAACTRDSPIVANEAATVGEPVRLKAHIDLAPQPLSNNRVPRAVALAAEVGHIFSRHGAQLCWDGARFALAHG